MTNEQKAQRLEEMAAECQSNADYFKDLYDDEALKDRLHPDDYAKAQNSRKLVFDASTERAALLRESAAMWRERGGVQWEKESGIYSAYYKKHLIQAYPSRSYNLIRYSVGRGNRLIVSSTADTMEAAQAAAVAWVDGQESI